MTERGRAIFARICDEWHLTVKHWLAISGQRTLLESNPALARSLKNRMPYLDPLNHLQVELIKRHRARRADRASNERDKRGQENRRDRDQASLTEQQPASGLDARPGDAEEAAFVRREAGDRKRVLVRKVKR